MTWLLWLRTALGDREALSSKLAVRAPFYSALVHVHRERSNLATQLKDTKSVVGRLRSVISVVLHIVFIFFYLMIYDVGSLLPPSATAPCMHLLWTSSTLAVPSQAICWAPVAVHAGALLELCDLCSPRLSADRPARL